MRPMNSRSDAENSHRDSEHSQSAVIRRDAAEKKDAENSRRDSEHAQSAGLRLQAAAKTLEFRLLVQVGLLTQFERIFSGIDVIDAGIFEPIDCNLALAQER